jgi:Flp pilus assembly protein TadD
MAGASFENRRRTVVPRWRNSKTTGETSELTSLGRLDQPKFDQRQFLEKLSDWKQVPNVATAAELFASALVLDKPDVAHETAEYLASCKDSIPDTLRRTAKLLLQQRHESDQYTLNPTEITRQRIRDLRMRLNEYPRDAVGWSDIAREYTSLGQLGHAQRAINVAISIAPNSRFILRTATRFFVHTDDPERAHDLLLASRSTPHDPWLVSAELAVAPIANVSPEFVREARQMVKSQKHPPRHLSEMTSALATLEMTDGNSRRARQLFRLALNDATENAIAQINWASRFIDSFDLDPSVLRVPRLFEARSWAYYNFGQWQDAFEQAWNWLFDQPFSRPPAIHGSFIASMLLEDYRSAEQMARIGLTANPQDFSLLNNLAVALSKQGKTGEAVNRCVSTRMRHTA